MGCHKHLLPQPRSLHFVNPLDCTVMCSSILDSILIVNKDQAIDELMLHNQPALSFTKSMTKRLSMNPWWSITSFCLRLLCFFLTSLVIFFISDYPCVNPSMDASTSSHSQNTPNVIPSFDSREDKSFIENPLDFSSTFSRNTEGEHSFLLSTPLFDSSNHKDANKHPEFSDHGCRELYTSSFDHDVDSLTINLSKPLVSDDISIDKVETLQDVKAL